MFTILAVRKVGHLKIKTKMFDFEARVLIGRLARLQMITIIAKCVYRSAADVSMRV